MKALFSLILFTTLFSENLSAHSHDHLWSTDNKAYEYTKNKLKKGLIAHIPSNKNAERIDVDISFLKKKLKAFSGAAPIIINGQSVTIKERRSSRGISQALSFLEKEYNQLGYKVEMQSFGSSRNKGRNIIATKKGTDSSKVLIISSHIDSVGNAGANDDGTGTIGNLAIAKALAPYRFKYDLRIIGFDKEERGLIGSKQYVRSLGVKEKKKILGVINFEMMGTNSRKDGHFHIIDCDRSDSTFMTKTMENIISGHRLGLTKVPGCTNRSDHASFWKAKIPAIVISENFFGGDSDACYHRKCDQFNSRLDFSYMEKITTATASSAYLLLQVL